MKIPPLLPKISRLALACGLICTAAWSNCSSPALAQTSSQATAAGRSIDKLAGIGPAPSSPTATVTAKLPGKPTGETPLEILEGRAQRIGHYAPEQMLRVVLAVKPPHMAEEETFLKELQDKTSPNFHKFLTPDEWDARFAPSVEDEQKVVDWAKSQGLTVTHRFKNRLLVDVEAPSGVLEKAFGVTINRYKVGEEEDFANDRDPVIPDSLSGILYSVQGLNNIQRMHGSWREESTARPPDYEPGPVYSVGESTHRDAQAPPPTSGKLTPGGPKPEISNNELDPTDIYSSQTYNYAGLQNLGHCCNPNNVSGGSPNTTSIAISAFAPYLTSDIVGFGNAYTYLSYDFDTHTIDGPYTCPNNASSCPSGETTQDTEWSLATANSFGSYLNTAQVHVYVGGNGNHPTATDMYNYMLSDNNSRVFSTSWSCTEFYGCSQSTMDSRHSIFNSMVGQGWTLVAASGDRGATDDCNTGHISVAYPASDPDFVAAGGTELFVYSDGSWQNEVAWSGGQYTLACSRDNNGGSGGGASAYYGQPGWQNGLGGSQRLSPDLSLNADGVGQNLFFNGSMSGDANGTSVSAPEWAGFFAQENAYLLAVGNICGTGSSSCAPIGNPNPFVYEEGLRNNSAHNPFYDITSGCNSDDITTAGNLPYFCAGTGYDQVTGWGSANMMQLAWALNWEIIPANGIPYVTFSGPATGKWYNTNQTVSWTVVDYPGNSGTPGSGIAGFTQGWDSILPDPSSEPHGGSGNSFYAGPEFANGSTGCLSIEPGGCGGGVSQGCHTVYVDGWNNLGYTTGNATYGPICLDTVSPTISIANSPATPASGYYNSPVQVSISAVDPGSRGTFSGIYRTYYAIDTGYCYAGSLQACNVYSSPFTISAEGSHYIYYWTQDNAGNVSPRPYEYVNIDLTPPVTTANLSGVTGAGGTYNSAVYIYLNPTDNLSGVKYTYYEIDGGAQLTYPGSAVSVSTVGAHSIKYWSVDSAGNTETAHVINFTIISPTTTNLGTTPNPSAVGHLVSIIASVTANISGSATGTVTFYDGGVKIGTSPVTNGLATFNDYSLALGSHTLTATYGGATLDLTSTSPAVTQQVVATESTKTVLSGSPNPVFALQPVTLTATVTPVSGSLTPAGVVTFYHEAVVLGSASLDASGKASITSSALNTGSYTLSAKFAASPLYAASQSANYVLTVKPQTTKTTLAASASTSTYGTGVTFTATVASTIGSGIPSGTVTFLLANGKIGTGTLNASGVATFTTSALAPGSDSVTAEYGGATDYATSASAAAKVTVAKVKSTTALATSATSSTSGSSVTLTATVTSIGGTPVPAGTITFTSGSTKLSVVTLNSSGVAVLETTALAVGSDSVGAIYSGDIDVSSSTATPVIIKVSR